MITLRVTDWHCRRNLNRDRHDDDHRVPVRRGDRMISLSALDLELSHGGPRSPDSNLRLSSVAPGTVRVPGSSSMDSALGAATRSQ